MTSPTEGFPRVSLVHCFSLLCVVFVRLKVSNAFSTLLHTYLKAFQFLPAVIKQEVTGRDELPFGSGLPAMRFASYEVCLFASYVACQL